MCWQGDEYFLALLVPSGDTRGLGGERGVGGRDVLGRQRSMRVSDAAVNLSLAGVLKKKKTLFAMPNAIDKGCWLKIYFYWPVFQ